MKKKILILISLVLVLAFSAACAQSPALQLLSQRDSISTAMEAPAMAPAMTTSFGFNDAGSAEMDYYSADSVMQSISADDSGSGFVPITPPVSESTLAEKIIYTVSADIETLDYERTIEQVYQLMGFHGGFLESSYVGGVNLESTLYGWNTMRQASFTLRIPTQRLNAVTTSLSELGNVASLSSDAQNITAQFTDSDARLRSLGIQEDRLIEMLLNAETIEDMLAIEDRLAGVRWHIESLTSTLRDWQNQIDYSTLNLFIREVEQYTERPFEVDERTYWQRIGEGFVETARSVGRFFMGLFMWIVVNSLVLVILAVVAVVVVIIVKSSARKARAKRNQHYTPPPPPSTPPQQ